MNILIVSPNPIWGGAATANIAISKLLNDNGNKVFYVDEFCQSDDISGLRIYHDKFAKGAMTHRAFMAYVKKNSINVVIWGVAMVMPYYYFTIKKLAKVGIKQIALFHSLSISQGFKGRLMEKMISFSIKPVDKLVYVSEFTRSSWSNKYKQFHKKNASSIVIHNPISIERLSNSRNIKDIPRLGFVGRFSEEKQPRIFCILSDCIEYSFYAWGEGPLLNELKDKYPNVSFMGLEKDIEKIYQGLDVLVLTSKFENCPMVILEAMARGIPCVAPKVGGISEIVKHGYNGRLFENYTSSDILSQVQTVIGEYSMYSANCVKEVYKYTSTSIWDKWKSII